MALQAEPIPQCVLPIPPRRRGRRFSRPNIITVEELVVGLVGACYEAWHKAQKTTDTRKKTRAHAPLTIFEKCRKQRNTYLVTFLTFTRALGRRLHTQVPVCVSSLCSLVFASNTMLQNVITSEYMQRHLACVTVAFGASCAVSKQA